MGNSTLGPKNSSLPAPTIGVGDKRPKQDIETVRTQIFMALAMNGLIVLLAILMIIIFHQRLKTYIPYLILQNVFVLDLITALTLGLAWSILLGLDNLGIIIPFVCRAVGFLHSFLYNAFILNTAVLSFSQFLLYISPALYGKIFVNCIVTRIFLLTVWSVAGLLSASPLSDEGGWGKYDMFESTCWVKWITTNEAHMSYNIFLTFMTLGPALVFTVLAVIFMIKGRPQPDPEPDPAPHLAPHLAPHPDVILITAIQLIIFFILWLALTIMNARWNEHWSHVDFKVDLAFLYLFFARGIWNPLVCIAVSENVRKAFQEVFTVCCKSTAVVPEEDKTQ